MLKVALRQALLMKRYTLVQHRYQEREEDSEDEFVPPAARSDGVGQLDVVCVPQRDHDFGGEREEGDGAVGPGEVLPVQQVAGAEAHRQPAETV